MAGYALNPITAEITYGLERIAMYCQKVDNVFDLRWNDTVTYRDVHLEQEKQFCELSKARREEINCIEKSRCLISHIEDLHNSQNCAIVHEESCEYSRLPF